MLKLSKQGLNCKTLKMNQLKSKVVKKNKDLKIIWINFNQSTTPNKII